MADLLQTLRHWWRALWGTYRWTWDAKNGWQYQGRTDGVNVGQGGGDGR